MPEAELIPDIADIVDPPQIAEPLGWGFWLAIVGALLLTAGIVTLLWFRARRPQSQPPPAEDPLDAAFDKLHHLKENYQTLSPQVLAEGTADALRTVLAARFSIGERSETTAEFFSNNALALARVFEPDRYENLLSLLEQCERLQFASAPDAPSARLPLTESAIEFLRALPLPLTSTKEDADPVSA